MILSAERLRGQLARLAGAPRLRRQWRPASPDAELEYRPPPDSRYVRRMATFQRSDPLAGWGFLTSGRYAECAAGRTLPVEGTLPVQATPRRTERWKGDRPRRRGDSGSASRDRDGWSATRASSRTGPRPRPAITRERCLLLAPPRDPFQAPLHRGGRAIGRVFLDVIQRDIMATLRQTLPPVGRLPGLQPVLADRPGEGQATGCGAGRRWGSRPPMRRQPARPGLQELLALLGALRLSPWARRKNSASSCRPSRSASSM